MTATSSRASSIAIVFFIVVRLSFLVIVVFRSAYPQFASCLSSNTTKAPWGFCTFILAFFATRRYLFFISFFA